MDTQSSNIYLYTLKTQANGTFTNVPDTEAASDYTNLSNLINTDKTNPCYFQLTISSMSFEKEMYKPNCLALNVDVTFDVGKEGIVTSQAQLETMFLDATLDVDVQNQGTKSSLVQGLIIMEVRPTKKAMNRYSLELKAYSPDQYLTRGEYCHSYLASKLGTHIIGTHPLVAVDKIVPFNNQPQNLAFSCYKDQYDKDNELRIPYAVQYNETFYNFVSREAQRLGEFLYYEDGALQLGVAPSTAISLNEGDYNSITTQQISSSKIETTGTHYNYNNVLTSPEEQYPYDVDFANDALMDPADTEIDDGPWGNINWILFVKSIFLNFASITSGAWTGGMYAGFGAIDFITKLGTEFTQTVAQATTEANKVKNMYDGGLENTRESNPYYSKEEQTADKSLSAFATYTQIDQSCNLNKNDVQKQFDQARQELRDAIQNLNKLITLPDAIHTWKEVCKNISDAQQVVHQFDDYEPAYFVQVLKDIQPDIEQLWKETGLSTTILLSDLTDPDVGSNEKASDPVTATGATDPKILLHGSQAKLNDLLGIVNENTTSLKPEDINVCRPLHRYLQASKVAINRFNDGYSDTKTGTTLKGFQKTMDYLLNDKKLEKDRQVNYDTIEQTIIAIKESGKEGAKKEAEEMEKFLGDLKNVFTQLKLYLNQANDCISKIQKPLDDQDKYGKKFDQNTSFKDIVAAQKDVVPKTKALEELSQKLRTMVITMANNNLRSKLYFAIKEIEETLLNQIVHVELNTNQFVSMPKLGSQIDIDGETYMVIKVNGKTVTATGSTQATDHDSLSIDVVPALTKKVDGGSDVQFFAPPLYPCRKAPQVGNLLARVTASADPKFLGRVRLKYNWKSSSVSSSDPKFIDSDTPWVRVTSPFASKNNAGVYFTPKVDDEVLVGFYNGQIERPFVIGSLNYQGRFQPKSVGFNGSHNTSTEHAEGFTGARIIATENGQSLSFIPGGYTMADSVVSFMPGLSNIFGAFNCANGKIVNRPIGAILKEIEGEDEVEGSKLRGITTLTDANNTWTIQGSTSDRSISIDSALGKVSISALTGINIEAPYSDVKISARNISLQATNNISIESGLSVKKQRKMRKDGSKMIADSIADALSDFITVAKVDMALLRVIWETFVPPVEGTLSITSNRYLLMQAGTGSVENPVSNTLTSNKVLKAKTPKKTSSAYINLTLDGEAENAAKYVKVLNNMGQIVDRAVNLRQDIVNRVNNARLKFNQIGYKPEYQTLLSQKKNSDIAAIDTDTFAYTALFGDPAPAEYTSQDSYAALKLQQWLVGQNPQPDENAQNTQKAVFVSEFANIKAQHVDIIKNLKKELKLLETLYKPKNDITTLANNPFYATFAKSFSVDIDGESLKWKTKKIDDHSNELVDNEVEITNLVKDLFYDCCHIYSDVDLKADTSAVADSVAMRESMRRVMIIQLAFTTGLYIYDKTEADKHVKEYWVKPASNILVDTTAQALIGENPAAEQATISAITAWDYFVKNQDLLSWKSFVAGATLYTEALKKKDDPKTKGEKVKDFIFDATGLGDLIDSFKGMGANIHQKLLADHNGKILMSDNNYTVSIDKNGNMVTSQREDKKWEK